MGNKSPPNPDLTKITCSKNVWRVRAGSGTQTAAGKVPPLAGKVSVCVAVDTRGI